ncbi:MAG: YHS domain-containing protein [Candidatus Omnitrophica bacterium]|nr:YHS domain-containing protein [Candidatus Omnitrophota bacterium]
MTKRFDPKVLFICLVFMALSSGKSYSVSVDEDGVPIAIQGYDPVAYHTEYHATKGYSSECYKYKDMMWYFCSTANKELFVKDPGRYMPAYNGYCAHCMSFKGFKKLSDPNVWTIEDERLFLFSAEYKKETWGNNAKKNIEKGDKHWESIN